MRINYRIIALSTLPLLTVLIVPTAAAPNLRDGGDHPIPTRKSPASQQRFAVFNMVATYLHNKDYKSAVSLMEEKVNNGFPEFRSTLGIIYLTGEGGIPKNASRGLKLLQEAAKSNDIRAKRALGLAYYLGEGVERDYNTARTWLEACGDDARAQSLLGRIFCGGLGTEKDYQKALAAFKKADAAGHDEKHSIALLYYNGGPGLEKNVPEAIRWYEAAAREDPTVYLVLAHHFMDGEETKVDIDKAIGYMTQSMPALQVKAKEGDKDAMSALAFLYTYGIAGKPNYEEARRLIEACGQHKNALNKLGSMYSHGQGGLPHDETKALETYMRAAKLGSNAAKANIGEQYFLGRGTEKDLVQAKKWLEEAAAKDDAVACYYMGVMYATGNGAEKDEAKAREFFKRARPHLESVRLLEMKFGCDFEHKRYLDSMNNEFKALSSPESSIIAGATQQSALPESTEVKTAPKIADVSQFFLEAEALVKKYYPRATVSKSREKMHFEFKTQKMTFPSNPNRAILVPKLDGILGDITLNQGRYDGDLKLPLRTNESLYESLVMAPYSTNKNCHLMSRLLFPSNVSAEFISEYKALFEKFE